MEIRSSYLLIILLSIKCTNQVYVNCIINKGQLDYLIDGFECEILNNLQIFKRNSQIKSINGQIGEFVETNSENSFIEFKKLNDPQKNFKKFSNVGDFEDDKEVSNVEELKDVQNNFNDPSASILSHEIATNENFSIEFSHKEPRTAINFDDEDQLESRFEQGEEFKNLTDQTSSNKLTSEDEEIEEDGESLSNLNTTDFVDIAAGFNEYLSVYEDLNQNGYSSTVKEDSFYDKIDTNSTNGTSTDEYVSNSTGITGSDGNTTEVFTNAKITSINSSSINSLVAYNNTIFYFPLDIANFFNSIKLVAIVKSQLKEIRQIDLKPFPELHGLWLPYNHIEVLEWNLFDNNPRLTQIILLENRIKFIHSSVFSGIDHLQQLDLIANECIDKFAVTEKDVVLVLENSKKQCEFDECECEKFYVISLGIIALFCVIIVSYACLGK